MTRFRGTSGNDRLFGSDYNDVVYGLAGNDKIWGGSGDDEIFTGRGSDTAFGGVGDDIIRSVSGSQKIFHGGAGNDQLSVELFIPFTYQIDDWQTTLDGGDGNDILTAIYDREGVFGGEGNVYNAIKGGLGNDVVYVRIAGGNGGWLLQGITANTVTGGEGDDKLVGLSYSYYESSNVIRGDAGNDTIQSASGIAQLYGGIGNDQISSESSWATIEGGAGHDRIISNGDFSQYDDTAVASGQKIRAGDGDDYVSVRGESFGNWEGSATATVTGDAGDDLIYVNLVSGSWFGGDTFADIGGGSGNDIIVTASIAYESDEEDAGARAINLVHGGAGNDSINATATIREFGDGGAGHIARNLIYGGDGDDVLTARIELADSPAGTIARNLLVGGAGNDVLEAWNAFGTNVLFGGAGDDTLRVHGNHTATLDGGPGDDMLYGDFGADTFVLRPGEGCDSIYGFDSGFTDDHIALGGGLTFGCLELLPRGAGGESTRILSNGEELAILVGVSPTEIDEGDFLLI